MFATAADGERIPIAILHRKGLTKTATTRSSCMPTGAYGSNQDAAFDSNVLSLVDRGFVYAEASIRAGARWARPADHGRVLRKKNTVHRFHRVAEHLIREKYTSKEKLAVLGRAPGAPHGRGDDDAARPVQGVVARVPLRRRLTTMADPSLPLVVIEYEEWGTRRSRSSTTT